MRYDIVEAALTDRAARPLLDGLFAEYRAIYGDLVQGEMQAYDAAEFRPPTGALLLLVGPGGETLAGGALRRWADGIGEIKRMWTAPAHRRRGHGRRVLAALEQTALMYGYRSVRLQTAVPLAGAVDMYRGAGYRRIASYGRYPDAQGFVSFQKRLPPLALAA
jgi:polar amino acid transport system permease protein